MKKTSFFQIKNLLVALLLATMLLTASCKQQAKEIEPFKIEHLSWVPSATIYEVNVRQYTPEGTFKAFESHLPRLKELGVDVLWFMPIHPIGVVNRKGSLGSYYSVKDYYGINPEYGTLDDFKSVVAKAHELGMKVIIDVVANHTSHDAVLISEHPDWYMHDSTGTVVSPFDWTDVAKLDYSKPELRKYMIDMLKYWVKDIDLDGFRCDVAAEVPADFWNEARAELNKVKPVFMLAEAENIELMKYAFDTDYAWEFHHIMNTIAQGKKNVNDLEQYLLKKTATYPKNALKMNFITNHDENSWNGTEFERMGVAVKTMATLSFVIDGMPLIYTGQEVGLNKRLRFFDKDTVVWNDDHLNMTEFYTKLTALKRKHSALNAGETGADVFRIKSNADSTVFAFIRENDKEKLFMVFNLTAAKQNVKFIGDTHLGNYTEYFSGEANEFVAEQEMTLEPWDYKVFIKQ
jgi:glycosidase